MNLPSSSDASADAFLIFSSSFLISFWTSSGSAASQFSLNFAVSNRSCFCNSAFLVSSFSFLICSSSSAFVLLKVSVNSTIAGIFEFFCLISIISCLYSLTFTRPLLMLRSVIASIANSSQAIAISSSVISILFNALNCAKAFKSSGVSSVKVIFRVFVF